MSTAGTVYVDDLIDRQKLDRRGYFLIGLLLLALVCDGFDLQLVGVAAPWLAEAWKLSPAQVVAPVQLANYLGMMIGATLLGSFGDRVGRKRLIVWGTFLYATATLACLATDTVPELATARFITGLGLGGVLPNVIALTAEMTPRARRATLTSIVIIGMSLGSGMPGVVAAQLVPVYGWQSLFLVGALVPFVIGLLLAAFLPESLLFLTSRSKNRAAIQKRVHEMDSSVLVAPDTTFALREPKTSGKGSFAELFSPGLRLITPLLWIMFACVLMAMHFLNSWISTLLKLANLSPTQFSLTNSVFHWGGTIAAIATALVFGRMGLKWVFVLLAIGMAGLLTIATAGFSSTVLLTFAVIAAGFGTIGCQGALNASAGLLYPSSCRTTGVGAALGLGRVGTLAAPYVGAYVLSLGAPVNQMFFVPMLPIAVAAVATLVLLARGVDIPRSGGVVH
jgi:MFS transporter, AAHS family, 4-hydroxybenzoate transporter